MKPFESSAGKSAQMEARKQVESLTQLSSRPSLITPAAIEAAALAIWNYSGGPLEFVWSDVPPSQQETYRTWALAALIAAAPHIAEECAKRR